MTIGIKNKSKALQALFGFNQQQWYRILSNKVDIEGSLRILAQFALEFNPNHKKYFNKYVFGRILSNRLAEALFQKTLRLSDLVLAYEGIYVEIDGKIKRSQLTFTGKEFNS